MEPVWAAGGCLVTYVLFYRFYARYLGRWIFRLDPDRPTPAHQLRDNVDYVPCRRSVLFGHHYASIAGLSPMLGPAIAVIWGWLPGMLWVVFGTLLIGAVHDFGALVPFHAQPGPEHRQGGRGNHRAASQVSFPRSYFFFWSAWPWGVFVHVVAGLFTASFYPEAVFPTFSLIVIALGVGWAAFRKSVSVWKLTIFGFALMLLTIWLGLQFERPDLTAAVWGSADSDLCLLRLYPSGVGPASAAGLSELLPPLSGSGACLCGFLCPPTQLRGSHGGRQSLRRPTPSSPSSSSSLPAAPFPEFHGLVSSGTTSKQISRETDAVSIGYGGMIGESLLGLMGCSGLHGRIPNHRGLEHSLPELDDCRHPLRKDAGFY